MGVSKTPRAFVTCTAEERNSSNITASTPAAATCTHSSASAAGQASASAGLKKSQTNNARAPGRASARVSAVAVRIVTNSARVSALGGGPRSSRVSTTTTGRSGRSGWAVFVTTPE